MKAKLAVLTLFFAGMLFAQTTTPPSSSQTSTGSTQSSGSMHHGMQGGTMQGSGGMGMGQHMQDMKQQVAKMRSLLEQMKANTASLTGKEKAAMEANVQLWQMMIDHMDQMVNHMSSMGGMGMGGMKMNGKDHHGAMQHHDDQTQQPSQSPK